jgi:signal transduction histidine kinase
MKDFSIFRLGVSEDMDAEIRRVTILSNGVYITVTSLITFYLLAFIPFDQPEANFSDWVPPIIWVTGIVSLVLNSRKLYTLSKALFMGVWILFTTMLPVIILGAHRDAFLMHPFYCIISSVMVHLMFSYHRERIVYIFFLTAVWILILFSVDFVAYFQLPDQNSTLFQNGFFKWRVITFMFAAFFNISMIYVLQINHRFYTELQKRNETISDQNRLLEQQRKTLEEFMVQLEDKVAKRTQMLEKQNEQLTEYSFFNSHILRAPVSRIRGLLNLLSLKIEVAEEEKVRLLLVESMNELDEAIKSINEKLQEVEHKD